MKIIFAITLLFGTALLGSCAFSPTPSQMVRIANSKPANFMVLTNKIARVSLSGMLNKRISYPNIEAAKKHLTFNYEHTQKLVKRDKDKIVWYNYYPGIEKKAATFEIRSGTSYEGQIFGGGYFNDYYFYMDKDLNILGHVKSR